MQLVTKAALIAALTLVLGSMLTDTVKAVEVSDPPPALLPIPENQADPPDQDEVRPAPPSPDCFILGSRSFAIPFSVDIVGQQPVEVQLYFARAADGEWRLFDSKHPSVAVKQFQFRAPADGEYWFTTRTIDARGKSHPDTPMESKLKVYVDTSKPIVKIDVDADSTGEIDAVLEVNDATPVKNLQLRYATDNVKQWRNVAVPGWPADRTVHFQPQDSWKQLSLQLIVTDTAGNQSVVTQLLKRPRLAEVPNNRYAAAPKQDSLIVRPAPYRKRASDQTDALMVADPVIRLDRNAPKRQPSPNLVNAHGYAPAAPWQNQPALGGYRGGAAPTQALPTNQTPSFTPAPPAVARPQTPAASPPPAFPFAPPSVRGSSRPASTTIDNRSLPAAMNPEQLESGFVLNSPAQRETTSKPESTPQAANVAAPAPQPNRARTPAEAMRPIGEASALTRMQTDREELPEAAAEEVATPKPEIDTSIDRRRAMRPLESALASGRAPVRYSDSQRFSLAYELEAVGSRGVEAIELYGSTDGSTWKLWGRDPDRTSPFDIATKEEGLFGFRIVVVSQNGLASPRPLDGEAPDIIVVVDKEAPSVRITGAQYGQGDRTGSLVIQYECSDQHLQRRPIALSFSDSQQGPWTTIAAGLRNDGDYVWPADPQLPRQLYLRIDATDQAGNVGSYILDQPIDVQGLAPRARIRGFQSLSGVTLPSPNEQTAERPQASFK